MLKRALTLQTVADSIECPKMDSEIVISCYQNVIPPTALVSGWADTVSIFDPDKSLNCLFFIARKPNTERSSSMVKDVEEWLFEKCPWFYLLSREQEEEYFSQWFDEVYSKEKGDNEDEEMV